MGLWSSIMGTIRVPISENFSLTKYTSHVIDQDHVLKIYQIDATEDSYVIHFKLNVSTDGVDASFIFNRYMTGILGSYDLETYIRHSS